MSSFRNTALRRLMTEWKELKKSPIDGFSAGPVNEDDYFSWEAIIEYYLLSLSSNHLVVQLTPHLREASLRQKFLFLVIIL